MRYGHCIECRKHRSLDIYGYCRSCNPTMPAFTDTANSTPPVVVPDSEKQEVRVWEGTPQRFDIYAVVHIGNDLIGGREFEALQLGKVWVSTRKPTAFEGDV